MNANAYDEGRSSYVHLPSKLEKAAPQKTKATARRGS